MKEKLSKIGLVRFTLGLISTLLLVTLLGKVEWSESKAQAQGDTFYVSTDGSDESGDGSTDHPWATITHALDNVPDGSTVLVRPGDYMGQVRLRGTFAQGITVRSETPYQARLRHDSTVVTCFYGQGITLEGFDVAHSGPGAGGLVIQIQDLIDGPDRVSRITLRDNVLHDSYNNDILKINNGASDVLVEGNLFYNQQGSDEHMDINSVTNVTIQDNLFFNDFDGSGRSDDDTSSFVVIKDSNGNDDDQLGSEHVVVRRNVFAHWEGSSGQGFVRVGEDGTANHEARDVLIENNLMLGNNTQQIRSPFQLMGVYSVTIRANTVVGDMPAKEFGARIFTYGANPDNDQIRLHNNIWSDPSGTMGDTFNRGDDTTNLTFDNNLFWNAGNPFPTSPESIIEISDDANRVVGDPLLSDQVGLVLPRWDTDAGLFADGSSTIRQAFERLVTLYGVPGTGSSAINAADPNHTPTEDILGNPRPSGGLPDIGAVEIVQTEAELALHGVPGDETIRLTWELYHATMPLSGTWQIDYLSETGTALMPPINLPGATQGHVITGLTNYVWYTVTLRAMLDGTLWLNDTVTVMPTDRFIYLPLVLSAYRLPVLAADDALFPRAPNNIGQVWANTGEDKVWQGELRATSDPSAVYNSAWDGTTVSLFGARNEAVGFNLVLEAPTSDAANVAVSLDSLTGPDGVSITTRAASTDDDLFNYVGRDIELFYVRYLEIKGLSQLGYENYYDERHIPERCRRPHDGRYAQDGTGWADRACHNQMFPDILVPLELHTPFTITAGTNQSIWGDIYVPKTAPTGIYTGVIEISEDGAPARQIPIRLRVRNFTLPDLPSARTMLAFGPSDISLVYQGNAWPNPGTPEYTQSLQLNDRHVQMTHRHKISLIGEDAADVSGMDEVWTARLSGDLFTPAQGYDGPGVGVGNNVYAIGTYGSWRWMWDENSEQEMQTNTDAWVNWFDAQAFETPTEYFLYLIDESSDYPQTEQWAQWMDNNPGPGGRLMSMATIQLPTAATETPSLDIAASWAVFGITDVWQNAADSYLANPDKRFYVYNGNRPSTGTFVTEDDGVALRVLTWTQYKKGIDRWFFWESTYYDNYQCYGSDPQAQTNVFQQAQTFGCYSSDDPVEGQTGWNYTNGDGVLFYPGTDLRYPEDSYGLMGPFASLRLKLWRRGIQDVDYLTMAAAIDPVHTAEIVDAMIPQVLWEVGVETEDDPTWVLTDISWSTDPDVWETARMELADIIEGGNLTLHGAPQDQAIHLTWNVAVTLPSTITWRIDYTSDTGTALLPPISIPTSTVRSHTLTGLSNYVWYTVTLSAVEGSAALLTDRTRAMPTDRFIYLPLILRQ